MPKQHLTNQFLKNLKPGNKRIEYFDQHLIENNKLKAAGVKGLLLRVTKAGNKYWYFSYWLNEKSNRYKIGSYPNIGLSEARNHARELDQQVNQGIDPQAEKQKRKAKKKPKTLYEVIAAYKREHIPTLSETSQPDYRRRIKVITRSLDTKPNILKRF